MRLLIFLVFIAICPLIKGQDLGLMPMPEKIVLNGSRFRINKDFNISIQGNAHERLYKEAKRFNQRLAERTGIFMKTWHVDSSTSASNANLVIYSKSKGIVQLGMKESYNLTISDSKVIIDAESDIGAIRALETLLQLINSDKAGFYFTGAEIFDQPRFAWRGLLISQPYHFMPMDVIKRMIDAMALVKLNVLHFYISDDQAYTIESKKFPVLHERASNGEYFTHEQIHEIISYADQRGIRVVPELDLPGHSTAILTAFPQLASIKREYVLQDHWGVFDPTIDPSKKETYVFLDTLLTEVASLFPDQYFHIGGDENNGNDWARNDSIQRFMKSKGLNSTVALQNYFNKKIQAILKKSNKLIIGWDEILMKEVGDSSAKYFFEKEQYQDLIQADVPKDIVIQSWRGMEALLAAAKNGYKGILSKGYYIDLMQPTWYHYSNDPIPNNNMMIIPDSEANFNRFESTIIDKIKKGVKLLSPEEEKSIIGGEATMWTEHVTSETIDSRIWPRSAAIAERLWSPAHINNVDDMYRRMDIISHHLEWVGSTHLKNKQMMLRRLAQTDQISSLEPIIDLLEPVKGYQRNREDNFTKYAPYTLLVDIAVADPKKLRDFKKLIEEFIKNGKISLLEELKSIFMNWQLNHQQVRWLAEKNPLLESILFHSESLSLLGEIGLKYIKQANDKENLKDDLLKEFNKIKLSRDVEKGYSELMVFESIERLIQH
jgi:hexosaminidase